MLKAESEKAVLGGTLRLTVYLPDYSDMAIQVKDYIDIQELINQILIQHKAMGRYPPLHYDMPQMYEIRMHEGTQ